MAPRRHHGVDDEHNALCAARLRYSRVGALIGRPLVMRKRHPPGSPTLDVRHSRRMLAVRASATPAVVLTPSGAARDVRGALYDTARAGIYNTADRAIAVSAADDAGSLAIAPEGMRSARGVALPRRASLAVLIAAAVLALMCIEWIATQRGRLQ